MGGGGGRRRLSGRSVELAKHKPPQCSHSCVAMMSPAAVMSYPVAGGTQRVLQKLGGGSYGDTNTIILCCTHSCVDLRSVTSGHNKQVSQGNVPGVESASLAMDTEEGVEVVWNEVLFSDKKVFKAQEDKIKEMFESLMQVEHPNIVKFHKYWLDMRESQARYCSSPHNLQVIFITEYMSSGSLKQFLKKTKKNHKTMNVKAWKRWCTQILSALSYLHSCDPPIIHGNLTCDTIFIQHNGLIKIGSVFPDAQGKGRPHRDEQRNLHFFPPEYGIGEDDYAIDIFSFGICTLEMAVLEIQANGDSVVSKEAINSAGHSLEDPLMKEFTQSCVRQDAKLRPTAHDLLFHRVLFEVHSLKLLAAHCLISNQYLLPENCVEEKTKSFDPNAVMAEISHQDRPGVQLKYSHVSPLELDKFLEDVKNGIYPLMNFASSRPHPVPRALSLSQEQVEAVKTPTPEPQETETRKVIQIHCNLESNEEGTKTHVSHKPVKASLPAGRLNSSDLSLFLKMDDKLHRQLSCDILPSESTSPTPFKHVFTPADSSKDLANELVHYAFINEKYAAFEGRVLRRLQPLNWDTAHMSHEDCEKLALFLDDAISRHLRTQQAPGTTQ
ncbi:Nuclear receptor-binding protein 2 [Merluccius polli]|uniref:Nuclear receptor-binding protein 2 n=1 Tax=Merluccius polli TaxID=89951 RepID=A0AA47MPS2_MERPO|nr:Nuclear receptor-binding protein 2 [Merluccius polli]